MIADLGGGRLPAYDPKRFDELVLYIAERTADDKQFGSTKVAKVLFYSDLQSHRELGVSITSAEYQHWKLGPYPPKFEAARSILRHSGRATVVKSRKRFEPDRIVPTNKQPADPQAHGITPEQLAIVDAWIERLSRATANEVSQLSHKHPGYQMVGENQPIPYGAAFLAESPPTDDDSSRAKDIAQELGWLVGNKWQRRGKQVGS
jgi:hypothetical protein